MQFSESEEDGDSTTGATGAVTSKGDPDVSVVVDALRVKYTRQHPLTAFFTY